MLASPTLQSIYHESGATLAADGIPLHFGDLAAEYHAALDATVLMDRSHEGRLELVGRDRLAVMHRISTNDLESLREGDGAPTIFTNANARILDRATVYHRGESAWVITEPGRADALRAYLQRNIFFTDEARLSDRGITTRQFALHGANADALADSLSPGLGSLPAYGQRTVEIDGVSVMLARRTPVAGAAWTLIVPTDDAARVWSHLIAAGAHPAGSLAYNILRIRAGRPGVGRELSADYLPLEVGLWDEVSFKKGCYTGQEIIARMESRGRLARTLVSLLPTAMLAAPAALQYEGRKVGTLTSIVETPTGERFALGVVKVAAARVGTTLMAGEIPLGVVKLPGAQPPFGLDEA
ncbi:MAG: glycine cleavage system protein T [Chloroflexota bacterium]|nr:glycine cleavage system protein T [Chloroflexota bacterium]